MKYCNCSDVTSIYSLNLQKLPGRLSYGLGMRLTIVLNFVHSVFFISVTQFCPLWNSIPPWQVHIMHVKGVAHCVPPGDYVVVVPIAEGHKVQAEIVHILYPPQVKHLKDESLW